MNSADPIDNVAAAFAASAERYPERPLLALPADTAALYRSDELSVGYADAAGRVAALREALADSGLGRGDRVALLLENRPTFFLHFLALNALGVSIVPLHHEAPAEDLAWRLGHSEARLLITLAEHRSLAEAARAALSEPPPLVVACEALPSLARRAAAAPGGRADEAAILYTSGSTGRPKGCLLSNEYFLELGRWYIEEGGYCELSPDGDRLITPLPVSHMNALACSFMAMLMSGGCVVQLDRFHPSRWWQQLRESAATIVHYLGVMPAILLKMPEESGDDFSGQVRFGFGAGVDPRHHAAFEQRFGFPLIEAWAMTETGAGACVAASHEPRHVGQRCFGRFPPQMQFRLVDEQGRDCPPGEPGELLVRQAGDNPRRGFFSGYLKDPEATAEAWAGGWFHTGDIVRQGPDGSMFFVDRRKNIVRRSGENIAAVEVEGALLALPQVASCAVAPVPDEMRGEEVMALVVPAAGESADEALARAIFEACRGSLAYFKLPGYLAFTERLPLTASEKLQRGELKKICAARVAAGEVYDFRDLKRRPKTPAGTGG